MSLYIVDADRRPDGFHALSYSHHWEGWLYANIPASLNGDVRRRLVSNLKHLLVGLELKAALIGGQRDLERGQRNVLFEPYYQNLILEFGVAAFSVLEGLGSALWLRDQGHDGADARRVERDRWRASLCAVYDADDARGLDRAVQRTVSVRDRLHQDRLGARAEIDWHALSYDEAFVPAATAVRTLFEVRTDGVPATTNLA